MVCPKDCACSGLGRVIRGDQPGVWRECPWGRVRELEKEKAELEEVLDMLISCFVVEKDDPETYRSKISVQTLDRAIYVLKNRRETT